MADQAPDNPFWDFTLAVYRREGVSQACIELQDRHGLDVNFLLLAVFAGTRGFAVAPAQWERLEQLARPWRENVIHPLRGVRRWLKTQASLPAATIDPMRRAVLAQEIESEGMQQRLMWSALAIPEGAPSLKAGARNLAAYCHFAEGRLSAEDLDALTILLSQALAQTTREIARAALDEAFPR